MPKDKDKKASRSGLLSFLSTGIPLEQLYLLAVAVLVLANARLFYGSLKMQTEQVMLWFDPSRFAAITHDATTPTWSAPLDDVFIHFDFARATAQGHPFEWIAGNGYSSGGTSLLYPFVLAIGYLAGFNQLDLMHWAAIVACVGIFAILLSARKMYKQLPAWTALLAPPIFLSVGALNWTLYSGMEVAMFLGFWGLCFVIWDELLDEIAAGTATRASALVLGISCALLVASRPEAAPLVAVFGLWCALAWWKTGQVRAALLGTALIGAPGAAVMLSHMVANHVLTGSSAAAGALAKLEMHHPYMTSEQVWNSWIFFVKYQFLRLSDYHFGAPILGIVGSGFLLWPLGALSLLFERTRRTAILLWVSILIWIALVGLNGQVRWQNERYTMPAVAWLLLAVGLGVGGALDWTFRRDPNSRMLRPWATRLYVPSLLCGALLIFVIGQSPRFIDQVWFFGRAARNILEQHVRAASALRKAKPPLHRVLLSDAGAIPYVSGLPAFDLIGLGGYGRLPIAGASRQGVGAAVELLQYVPTSDLPDVMALYPSWWGDFVLWFGRSVDEFPVRGNVICGGASKVVYAPRWAPILHSGQPIQLLPTERVFDTVDIADIISEQSHDVSWDRPAQGYVSMKLLPDERDKTTDLWDAGRLLSTNMSLYFKIASRAQSRVGDGGALLIRVAPARSTKLELRAGDRLLSTIDIEASDFWQEKRVALPDLDGATTYHLRPIEGELIVYHIFAIERVSTGIASEESEVR